MNTIGVHVLSNTAAILVHEIDYTDDRVLISLNGKNEEWADIQYDTDEENEELGFYWGNIFIPFAEVMRFERSSHETSSCTD